MSTGTDKIFLTLCTEFIIDRETLFILRDELDQTCLKKLTKLLGIKAPDFISFSEVMTKKLGQKLWKQKGKLISQAAELGRRKFLEKLGWLLDYKKELDIYAEILEVFALAKKQLNKQGLHPLSQPDWLKLTENFSDSAWIQSTQQKVSEYLAIEGEKIPKNQAFLATSDIIESIFGKYKIFASSSPNSEINEMILTLLLSTTKLTPDKVLQAMETIHLTDVDAWSQEVFGQSILSKRKLAFSTGKNYIKVA